MSAIVFRIVLLTLGLAAVEIGIIPALTTGSLIDWALVLLIGLPLIIAGSAGFVGPLLGGPRSKDESTSA
ncbi:MAG: hypothetical protein ACC726_09285 [Chloroflexota bacterium]